MASVPPAGKNRAGNTMAKKAFSFLLALCLTLGIAGCSASTPAPTAQEEKIRIVATLFPQYDFAKAIAGDKAEVTLLLPPGMESHAYEPTPQDVLSIHQADLFLYTGPEMETWAQSIVESLPADGPLVVNVSQGIVLTSVEEEHGHSHDDGHHHTYDPHIWTDPLQAKQIVQNICSALSNLDTQNADLYQHNTQLYLAQLDALDEAFRTVVAQGRRTEMIFGSPFSLYYFTQRYGLSYEAAFDSCTGESEPSVATLVHLIEHIKQAQIPVVYITELSDPKIAQSISEETGAEILLFHACHNVSREDFQNGVSYLSLMWQNVEHLKKGLQ